MELDNRTISQVRFFTTELRGEAFTRAVVIVKTTYDLAPDGSLRPSKKHIPVLPEPLITPYGTFHGELFPRKRGADLCVLATVRRSVAVASLKLVARVAAHERTLRVIGDRVWHRRADGTLVPSAPSPFAVMPLTYSRAFGGKVARDGGDVAWPDNPDGRGFYLTEAEAEGRPLPNLEHEDGPRIERWDDRPDALSWGPYPMMWARRAREGVHIDEVKNRVKAVRPSLFNHANPAMVLPSISPGDLVSIEGLRDAVVRFEVPRRLSRATLEQGNERSVCDAVVDGVFAWLDHGRVVVTERLLFQYVPRRGVPRRATLTTVDLTAEKRGA